ncbi:MAG: phosphotransferase [Gammaproteobacteria bacterium]|nr:phosphotransferase [Gammaproteobacteria bacterium]
MSQDPRLEQIKLWLATILSTDNFEITPASSDASFRRYFRVFIDNKTWIVMDAPPEHEDIKPFTEIATFLYQHDIHVPKIDASNQKLGFLLLSDFGNQSFLDKLNEQTADTLYKSAIESLIQIQLCPSLDISLPHYDRALLHKELDLFPEWFLGKHLNIPAPDFLQSTFDKLINHALEQPQLVVHRDYHSRNLMYTSGKTPGIIDFQDAVIGPITYDLVSLLRDCYISWPSDRIDSWINYYFSSAQQHGLLAGVSIECFVKWFDWMGLQRHLKVLGIFSRLNYRDNKPDYIHDLPLTLSYVRQVSGKYAEFSELSQFLEQHSRIRAL